MRAGSEAMSAVYMMFSVLCWSLFPLLSAWGVNQLGVFDYIFWTYVVGLIASWGLMRVTPGYSAVKNLSVRKLPRGVLFEIFVGCLTVLLSFACLLKSFAYMSKAGATVIFEIWPVIAMYITPLLIRRGYSKISRRDIGFSLLAFIGVAFLMYPEVQKSGNIFICEGSLCYVVLPLIGGMLMAIASVVKSRVSHTLENKKFPIASLLRVQVFFSAGVTLLAIPFMLFFPQDVHSVYTPQAIAGVVFIGLFIHTLGNISYTLAVLGSKKSNIVVLWYLMPIFSVIWLWLAGESKITSFIVLGSIYIITSNLIMTVKADRSTAYSAALVMMLLGGTYVFFTDGLSMTQNYISNFYDAISVPIVFYTILVAFMMDRLIRSDRQEEAAAIKVINYIDDMADKLKGRSPDYIAHVVAMVSTNDAAAVNLHYRAVRNAGEKAMAGINNDLDELAVSKVRQTSFAEVFILTLVGLLIIATAMVFRPTDIVGDSFAVVLSLTIVFIFFMVLDLHNKRREFYLQREANGHRTLAASTTQDLTAERAISLVLILFILAAYIGLLWAKRYAG